MWNVVHPSKKIQLFSRAEKEKKISRSSILITILIRFNYSRTFSSRYDEFPPTYVPAQKLIEKYHKVVVNGHVF